MKARKTSALAVLTHRPRDDNRGCFSQCSFKKSRGRGERECEELLFIFKPEEERGGGG